MPYHPVFAPLEGPTMTDEDRIRAEGQMRKLQEYIRRMNNFLFHRYGVLPSDDEMRMDADRGLP